MERINMKETTNDFQWRQFCRLGEMIGDGLHHEEPWISKEYKRLQKILLPETPEEKEYNKKMRQQNNQKLNEAIAKRLETDKCVCGSDLKQTRSGSRTVKCTDENCGKKYKYRKK